MEVTKEKVCYKILIPHYFSWEVRYFSVEKIDGIEELQEAIKNICETEGDFFISWSKPEKENAHSEIVVKTNPELEAAQDYMMKNCKCGKNKCQGSGEIVFSIIYNRCC